MPQQFRVLPQNELSERHFDEWPVWSEHYDFDEIEDIERWGLDRGQILEAFRQNERDGEHSVYTMLEANPFPPRMRIFIKASLEAPNGERFKGFVMNEGECLAVFLSGEQFTFNSHPMLRDLNVKEEQRLLQCLGRPSETLFPMKYETAYQGSNGELISGSFRYDENET